MNILIVVLLSWKSFGVFFVVIIVFVVDVVCVMNLNKVGFVLVM